MPTRKQEKRRRKLRVHGPSADGVGAPPTGRKPPREERAPARGNQRGRREPPVPSLRRSARKGGFMAVFMVAIVVVTTRSHGNSAIAIALGETLPLVVLFVVFDLWMARKIYKRFTGVEAPR